ncbi:MAG: isoprenylcysteine carboxylmethyltransferase family protein [Acidimicrobiia bacterium]|nr:isoprenylcysteine carboxylmethyltransferase family protein [Acidimicrobiia bacterium]
MQGSFDYGFWPLVVIHSLIFIIFAFSFTKPKTKRDWRSLGAFSAFVVALFTEMYGVPLTIYLLSGWLQSRYPGLDVFSHESGHLWNTVLGLQGNAHFDPMHVLSNVFIFGGFIVLARAWRVLHKAQQEGTVAMDGPYARVRHPQYTAFIVIMVGFLLQWPTILTAAMFPVLVWMYVRLARREEAEVRAELGEEYDRYAAVTPAFIPRLGASPRTASPPASGGRV